MDPNPFPSAKNSLMEEEGNKGGGPVPDRFIKGSQQQSERTPSGSTDSVPYIFCGDLKIPLEQVEDILQPSLCAAEARVTFKMQQFVESIESNILSAVKQAAMDIIKHLGKEAAMRVLVAERKSIHFEQELMNTKQEALTTLVRLKQSMDAQIVEAERACQIERRRTQEMEEKLMTLQGTVKKLKDELKKKKEALEKIQQMVHPPVEHCGVEMHSPKKYSTMQVMSSPRRLHEQILIRKSYMPSIIMKSKEQAIPPNGYNSGIYEETTNESISDVLPMQEGNEKKECISAEDNFAPHSLEKTRDTDVASHQSQPVMPDANCSWKQDTGCFVRQSSLLVNYIAQSDSAHGVSVHTDGKQYASSESDVSLGIKVKLMATDTSTEKVVNVKTENDLAHHPETYDTSILPQDKEAKVLGFETSMTPGDDEPASSFMENLDVPSVEKDASVLRPNFSMYVKEKDIPKDNCRTSDKHGDQVFNVESSKCSSHENSSAENGGTYLETACNKVASEVEVSNAIRSDEWKRTLSVDSNISKTNCDKVVVTGNPSAVDDSYRIPSQMRNIDATEATENQIFGNAINQRASCRYTKYTFQRKRRRESSFQQNGNLIREEKDPKRAEIKHHEYFLNACSGKLPQKQRTSNLALSPRDSRRLMLGAHQLVSLSEKKSWC